MSLVDYASSSDDEDAHIPLKINQHDDPSNDVVHPQPRPTPSSSQTQSSMDKESTTASALPLPAPTFDKLPDASLLLNSPILPYTSGISDHSSRVAAAVAANASRKRESNGSTTSSTRGKVPRGNIPHSKNIPDTNAGHLVPPQLRGRSNVVTEDIGRLFVKKQGQT